MTPKNDIILIDVDSVLLEWRRGFRSYMHHQGHKWIDGEAESYIISRHFELLHDEVVDHVNNFNNGHWEFGTLTPVEGAVEGMQQLVDMGFRFVAISSCSINPTAIALRKANLYNVFGDVFDAVHCVEIYSSKETHLADYEPTFWIEDNLKNCVDGLKYGHKCLLLSYAWNDHEKADHNIKVCDEWSDIVSYIKDNIGF